MYVKTRYTALLAVAFAIILVTYQLRKYAVDDQLRKYAVDDIGATIKLQLRAMNFTVEDKCARGHYLYRDPQAQKVNELPYVYTAANTNQTGKPFHTQPWPDLLKLDLLPKGDWLELNNDTVRKSIVFVTGCSSNHFQEGIAALDSAKKLEPRWKIVYYDLGLNADQVKQLKSWCNVEYRFFNFSSYPSHVTNLYNYAWKILIIADVLKTYNGLVWFDSSIRFPASNEDLQSALQMSIRNGGFTMLSCITHSLFTLTYPMMFDYLPFAATQKDALSGSKEALVGSKEALIGTKEALSAIAICQGGALLIHNTEAVFYDVLWPMYMCALQKLCIAPTKDLYCNYKKMKLGRMVYADCHRYDMSAMNILLLNKWHFDPTCYRMPKDMVGVSRGGASKGIKIDVCS